MKKGVRVVLILLVIIVVIGGLGILAYTRFGSNEGWNPGPNREAEPEQALSAPVAVTPLKEGSIEEILLVHGEVLSLKEVSILSSVPGEVKSIRISEGDRVARDQVLAYVERDEAGLKYADAAVESTINGIVKKVLTEEGASITPSTPLFQVVDMDAVEVAVHIPEKDVQRVKKGLEARVGVIAYPDRTFRGNITRLSPVLDPASRSREARIRVPNPGYELKPGMFGTTEIIIRRLENALIVPYSAIIDREGKRLLYRVEEGKARAVEPEILVVKGEQAAVAGELAGGDRIIVIGQHNIKDGDPVSVAEEIQ